MVYPKRDITLATLFCFLAGLLAGDSWARDTPFNTESTLNANNFRFNLSWHAPKQDHALASRAVELAPRTDASFYDTCATKGNNLICVTQMDNAEATKKLIGDPAAKYTTVTDLTDAGWIQYTGTVTEIAAIETKLRGYLDLTLLDGLGVNLVNNVLVDWRWIVGADGVLTADEFEALSPNAPTGVAMSQNWYNVEGGLIIVNSAWSPKYMYGQSSGQSWWPSTVTEKTVEELTVSKSSDVMYIEWASQAEDVTTLQYVIQLDVVNLGSRSVMNTVMQDNDWSTPTFFYQGSTEFDALLGTPNGNPQAWILINHKAELGVKTVYSIMIWTSSTVMEGAPNVYLDTDEGGNAASLRNMCYVYYDEQEEEEYSDSEIEDSDSEDEQPLGFWGLCQHMLFTFEDVSTSEEDAMDLV